MESSKALVRLLGDGLWRLQVSMKRSRGGGVLGPWGGDLALRRQRVDATDALQVFAWAVREGLRFEGAMFRFEREPGVAAQRSTRS